jgi:predicted transcriptional regulator
VARLEWVKTPGRLNARLEAGGVTPNLDTLHRIADALGLELIVDLRRARRSA